MQYTQPRRKCKGKTTNFRENNQFTLFNPRSTGQTYFQPIHSPFTRFYRMIRPRELNAMENQLKMSRCIEIHFRNARSRLFHVWKFEKFLLNLRFEVSSHILAQRYIFFDHNVSSFGDILFQFFETFVFGSYFEKFLPRKFL